MTYPQDRNYAEQQDAADPLAPFRQEFRIPQRADGTPGIYLCGHSLGLQPKAVAGVIQEELIQMWNTSKNTVFMVTHDVDEAILLSDRIMLMTNGPSARIGEIVEVTIPRPRSRETIIDHPHYYKIRNHVIHFLVRHAAHTGGIGSASGGKSVEEPVLVRF